MSVNGAQAEVQNIGINFPGCVQLSADEIECSVPADAPAGSDSFEVKLWDQNGGQGNLLGVGDTTADVTGIPADQIVVTVKGVVASIKLAFGGVYGPEPCGGASQSAPLSVQAFDADGNLITGSADYHNPISVAPGDAYGSLSVSPPTVTSPSTVITVGYSNGPTTGTINASADGAPTASVSFDPKNYVPLNASYTYEDNYGDQWSEVIGPATSLPANYFNLVYNNLEDGNSSVSVLPVNYANSIPSAGVCDVHVTPLNGTWSGSEDSYIGVSTGSDGRKALVLYLEWDSFLNTGTGTTNGGWASEYYFPIPSPVDYLPEQAGDSWSADPSLVDVEGNPQDWTPSAGANGTEMYANDTSTLCYFTEASDDAGFESSCDASTPDAVAFTNNGVASLPTECGVDDSIATTANDVQETWTNAYGVDGSIDYYDVDGIGTVCANDNPRTTGYLPPDYTWYWLTSMNQSPQLVRRSTSKRPQGSAAINSAVGSLGWHAFLHSRAMRRRMCAITHQRLANNEQLRSLGDTRLVRLLSMDARCKREFIHGKSLTAEAHRRGH